MDYTHDPLPEEDMFVTPGKAIKTTASSMWSAFEDAEAIATTYSDGKLETSFLQEWVPNHRCWT